MSDYFDSSVLVLACGRSPSGPVARRKIAESNEPVTTPHALAECFNSLTYRLGFAPKEVRRTMRINLGRFRFITMEAADYQAAIDRVIEHGLTGDKVYDALHIGAAEKAGAGAIHTSNKRDFAALKTVIPIQKVLI